MTLLVSARPNSRNPAAVYLAGLAAGSRPAMTGALETMAALLVGKPAAPGLAMRTNWAALRFSHTAALRAQLADRHSAAYVNKMLSALRGVLKAAWRLGLMGAEDYQRAVDVSDIKGSTVPRGRALTAGELAALMQACSDDATAAGARDAAMLALLRVAGLRRAELCALTLADFEPAAGELRIVGKGNKQRGAFITSSAAAALTDWLHVRGHKPGALFCPINRGGLVTLRHMHPAAVYRLLAKRARQANVKEFSPHDLRRTFVSDLLDAGADISTVQRLAGHASVNTTARYDRRPAAAQRKAVELLPLPYQPRRPRK